jgi:hypothetical protein
MPVLPATEKEHHMTTPDCPGHKDAARPAAEGPKEKAFPTSVNDQIEDEDGETDAAAAVRPTVEDPPEYTKADGPKEKAFPTSVNDQTT